MKVFTVTNFNSLFVFCFFVGLLIKQPTLLIPILCWGYHRELMNFDLFLKHLKDI